ncbi:MAG: RidA family protein [Chloroflexota bacterium]
MANAEARLQQLGITVNLPATPLGAYVPTVRAGNLVFVSGTMPVLDGKLVATGKVGAEVSIEQGRLAARQAMINALGSLKGEIGSLDRVKRIVRVEGHVASAPGFIDQPQVVNGASELLAEVFGDAGKHTRVAVGSAELPLNAPIEIALIAEVDF